MIHLVLIHLADSFGRHEHARGIILSTRQGRELPPSRSTTIDMRDEEKRTTSSVLRASCTEGCNLSQHPRGLRVKRTPPWATLHVLRILAVEPDRDLVRGERYRNNATWWEISPLESQS